LFLVYLNLPGVPQIIRRRINFREWRTGEGIERSSDVIGANIPAFGWNGSGTMQTLS